MWVKLDDEILENKKVLKIGPKGLTLYISGLIYCGRSLTDGFIPKARLYGLAPWLTPHEVRYYAKALVDTHLWTPGGTRGGPGYRVHDYLKYNPSKAAVMRSRQNTAERVRRWRARRGYADVPNGVTNSDPAPAPVTIRNILNPPTPHEAIPREARQTPTVEQTKAYLNRIRQSEGPR